MQPKKIFLASSCELLEDRKEFEIFINRKNNEWVGKGVHLKLIVWEDFLDAVSQTRLQDEYNKAIRECDIFVMLFFTKVGPYTAEEFETAFGQFKATNKPFIYTYFKDAQISTGSANQKDLMSLGAFQEKLKALGHFYTSYKNIDALKLHFNAQLDKLAANGFIEFEADESASADAISFEATRNGNGATAVGAGGIYNGGQNTGSINTGTQTNNCNFDSNVNNIGAHISGSINTGGGHFIGRDKITQGIAHSELHAQNITINIGNNKKTRVEKTGDSGKAGIRAPLLHEKIRLDVASPSSVLTGREFDVAVAIKQLSSPPLSEEDLDNTQSTEGVVIRKSNQHIVKYRVEIHSADFDIKPEQLVFNLQHGCDSEIKWFKLTSKNSGKLTFIVSAYQFEGDVEIASTRIKLESCVSSQDKTSSHLRWLHISDIHFWGKNDWRDSAARDSLVALLKEKFASGKLPKPDIIFCTGDMAQGETSSGQLLAQYTSVKEFFNKILEVCDLSRDRIFIVPGNHDVNRNNVSPKFQKSLVNATIKEIGKDWADQNDDYKQAIGRLNEYGQFVKSYLTHQPDSNGRHCYAKILDIKGIRLGIGGFNSAWTSHDDNDKSNLWLAAEWQFNAAHKVFGVNTQLNIGLMHHPVNWLKNEDERLATQRIRAGYHFWLHGHEHNAWVTPTEHGAIICAGAVNAGSEVEFGINLVDLNLSEGTGKIHLYAYQTGGNVWLISPNGDAPDGIRKIRFEPIFPVRHDGDANGNTHDVPGEFHIENTEKNKCVEPTPNDAERVAQAKAKILAFIGKTHFNEFTGLQFADDGLPQKVSNAFPSNSVQVERTEVADRCMTAIRSFAKELVGLASSGTDLTINRKADLRARLIDAMRQAMRLYARREMDILDACDPDNHLEMDVEIGGTVSLMLREKLANLEVEHIDGKPSQFVDPHVLKSDDVELGTGDGAQKEAIKMIWNLVYPAEKFPAQGIEGAGIGRLKTQASLLKEDGNHLMVLFHSKNNFQSLAILTWMKKVMHLAVVNTTMKPGMFDPEHEGVCYEKLADLFIILRPFAQNEPTK